MEIPMFNQNLTEFFPGGFHLNQGIVLSGLGLRLNRRAITLMEYNA